MNMIIIMRRLMQHTIIQPPPTFDEVQNVWTYFSDWQPASYEDYEYIAGVNDSDDAGNLLYYSRQGSVRH